MSRNWRHKKLPKLLVVVGPTASGKSDLAIKLARRFHGEIISADSRQIYRQMDIGTAKVPILPERSEAAKSSIPPFRRKGGTANYGSQMANGIVHHLIDIKNPDEEYSVAEYKHDAVRVIRGILRRGKLPILVGGTGLYIKAVVENLNIPKVKANPKLRKKLEKELQKKGLAHLAEKLVNLDPEAAYVVDLKNPRRVIRALEVALQTGKPFTAQRRKGKPLFDALVLGIKIPQVKLRKRIDKRVDEMIRTGLVKEIQGLVRKYGRTPVLLNTIGYKEIIYYLDRKTTLQEAVAHIKTNTWRYAKRQMTWSKKDKRIRWITRAEAAYKIVGDSLQLPSRRLQQ